MKRSKSENIEQRNLLAQKVYDPFLRFLHWWNALSIFSLMLTIWLKGFLTPLDNKKEILYNYHILIGYALTAGILARIIWGFIGPKHAKFKNMFRIKDYIQVLKTRKLNHKLNWGHDRYAGLLYIVLYILMIYQAYSGLYLAAKKYAMGPLVNFVELNKEKTPFAEFIKDIHEVVFYVAMGFAALHIFMLIFHEITEKYPFTQSMFSGYQYRKKDNE